MKSKISLKQTLLISLGAVIVLFLFSPGFYAKQVSPGQGAASIGQVSLPAVQVGSGLPVRFRIPRINIDSAIEHVGLTPEGAMDAPKGPADVAWFKLGTRPGEIGSAVIAGHYGWKNNIPAVFDNLYELQKGDKIYVEDEKGVTTTFVVRGSKTYGENEDASDVFGSGDGKAHLNLVTCEGAWNKAKKSYSKRLVVFTDKE